MDNKDQSCKRLLTKEKRDNESKSCMVFRDSENYRRRYINEQQLNNGKKANQYLQNNAAVRSTSLPNHTNHTNREVRRANKADRLAAIFRIISSTTLFFVSHERERKRKKRKSQKQGISHHRASQYLCCSRRVISILTRVFCCNIVVH